MIRAALLLYAGVLGWGLARFGAVEPQSQYSLYLLLLVPALMVIWDVRSEYQPGSDLLLMGGALLLLQVIFQDTVRARGYLILALGFLAFTITLVAVRSDPKWAGLILGLLIVLAGAEAMYGLVQALGGHDYIFDYPRGYGRIASGTFINRNHFAGLMNMALPLAIAQLYSGVHLRRRSLMEFYGRCWVILIGCSLIGLAILLTASRGGMVVMIATLLFVAGLIFIKRSGRFGLSTRPVWITLLGILGLGLCTRMDTLLFRVALTDMDLRARLALFRDSLQLIAENPLLGVGPGMYQWSFRRYQSLDSGDLFVFAHNDYLQAAAEWGLPIAILFWGFVFWRLVQSARIFSRTDAPQNQVSALGCSAALFAVLLQSLFDFNLQIPSNLMVFATILGISFSGGKAHA